MTSNTMAFESEPDPLPPGHRLGPYVIECELPSAEYGRVYKALDSRFNVTVAINVLAAGLRKGVGELRWTRDIKRASQKPNSQVRDFGYAQEISYVVVAYLEGIGAAIDVGKE